MTKRLVLLLIVALSVPLALLVALRLLWATLTAPARAWLIVIAYDDLWNVVSNGDLGQTISYRAATAMVEDKKWGCVLCKWLDEVQQGHCEKALADGKQNMTSKST
jgi:hypothetical protein